ncbi:MAG: hypothetical protein AVDCRST_MAG73-967, partial [uncultured Thermomicrobiales bacterium]
GDPSADRVPGDNRRRWPVGRCRARRCRGATAPPPTPRHRRARARTGLSDRVPCRRV